MKHREFYLPSLLLSLLLLLLISAYRLLTVVQLCLSILKSGTLSMRLSSRSVDGSIDSSKKKKKDAKGETLFNFLNLEIVFTFIHINHCALIYIISIIYFSSHLIEPVAKFL